jgi:putative exporter of polyketide antibiotics
MADENITPAPEYDDALATDAFAAPASERRRSGKAVAALVCGILSLVVVGIILGLVAIALGIAARKDMEKDPTLDGTGLAVGGMVTGAIGAVLAIIFLATGVTNF